MARTKTRFSMEEARSRADQYLRYITPDLKTGKCTLDDNDNYWDSKNAPLYSFEIRLNGSVVIPDRRICVCAREGTLFYRKIGEKEFQETFAVC